VFSFLDVTDAVDAAAHLRQRCGSGERERGLRRLVAAVAVLDRRRRG
jgi:hypothetical protein